MIRKTMVKYDGKLLSLELDDDVESMLGRIYRRDPVLDMGHKSIDVLSSLGLVRRSDDLVLFASLGIQWMHAPEDPPILEFAGKSKPANDKGE